MAEHHVEPWEQQDDESDEAFDAWSLYLQMGPDRSITRVAEQVPNSEGGHGKARALIGRWSSRHRWADRLKAFNRSVSFKTLDKLRNGQAEMRERLAVQGKNMQAQAALRLANLSEEERRKLSVREAVALTEAGARLERAAREISESDLEQGTVFDTPVFTVTFLDPRPAESVPVRLGDGTTGYIPTARLEEFTAKYPDAVVVR